jgi:hypothetical protein
MDKKHVQLIALGLIVVAVSYYFFNKKNAAETPAPSLDSLFDLPDQGFIGNFLQGWDATMNSAFGTHYGQT